MPDYAVALAMLIAISLAGERIVAIVKNVVPSWFAEPAAGSESPRDHWRRLRVQAVAFVACWVCAGSLATGGFALNATISLGGLDLHTTLVGFLAMGGSAFWAQMLGISSALKDLKKAQVDIARNGPAAAGGGGGAAAALQNLRIARVEPAEQQPAPAAG